MNNLTNLSNDFLHYCQNNRRLSQNTIRVYQYDLLHFIDFLSGKSQSIIDFTEVTKTTLEDYLSTLERYSVKTIRRKFACIRSLFRYLEYQDNIDQNPFLRFHIDIREPYRVRTAMSMDEINKLLSAAYNEKPSSLLGTLDPLILKITSEEFIWIRDIAIVELLFVGGLRVSELCSLKFDDIDLDYHTIMVHGKGNKERLIYLENTEVIVALARYLNFRKKVEKHLPYLFITKFGQMLSTQAVRNLVTKYTRLSGLEKNITPHVFRHTFATLLLEEGVDIKYIQDFLGHSSITTTQIYLHTTNRQKRRIIATQHPRQKMYFSGNSSEDNVKLTSRRGEAI
jgi:integrase/recombinase XerD